MSKSPDLGRHYEIPDQGLVIGNTTDSDIFLHEPLNHRCRIGITAKHGTWQMEDLEPVSGVMLNYVVAQKGRMFDGDLLQIGTACFECCTSIDHVGAFSKEKAPT